MSEELWEHYRKIKEAADPAVVRREIGEFLDALEEERKGAPELGEIKGRAVAKIAWMVAKRIWKSEVKGVELRELMRLGYRIYAEVMKDCPANAELDPRRVFLNGLVHRLTTLEKGNGANRVAIPAEIAKEYLTIVEKLLPFLNGEDFNRRPASSEIKAKTCGKVKDFPSNFEKAMGFAHRCMKQPSSGGFVLKPTEVLLEQLKRHIECGKWLPFYYGTWLVYAGRQSEARKYLAETTAENITEAWAWNCLGETYAEEDVENHKRCLAKALLCPVRDAIVSNGIAKRSHRALAIALRKCGDEINASKEDDFVISQAPLPGNSGLYRTLAEGAEKLVCDGRKRLWIEGTVARRNGQSIAFVRGNGVSCFVSPKLTDRYRLADGMKVKGIAERAFDKKKNRDGWAMVAFVR